MSDGRKERAHGGLGKRDGQGHLRSGGGGPSGSGSAPPPPPDVLDYENLDFDHMEDAVDNLYMTTRDVESGGTGTSRYPERKREQLKVIENMIERLAQERGDLKWVKRRFGESFEIIQKEQDLIDKMMDNLEDGGGPCLEGMSDEEYQDLFQAAFLTPDSEPQP